MAFSGVHIVFSYAGTKWYAAKHLSVLREAISSQTMAAAMTSDISAPAEDELNEDPLLTITASLDVYFAVGAVPDASQTSGAGQSARYFMRAGDVFSIRVSPGAKVAWIAA